MKTIKDIFPRIKAQEGEVGIEIEMEGVNLPAARVFGWACKEDGSLRGESMEYVLKAPCKRNAVAHVLATLWKTFKETESKLNPSRRCGVHIHLNVQDFTFDQVMNLATLYIAVEDVIVKFCGEDREGNMFALRSSDSEYLPHLLMMVKAEENLKLLQTDNVRYASLNMSSLSKHGSMEWRPMRTTADPEDVENWASILLQIKDKSLEYGDSREIISKFSALGPQGFLKDLLGPYYKFYKGIPGLNVLLLQGMRRAQPIAFTAIDLVKKKAREDQEELEQKLRGADAFPQRWACKDMPNEQQWINVYRGGGVDLRDNFSGNYIISGGCFYQYTEQRGWERQPKLLPVNHLVAIIDQPWAHAVEVIEEEDDYFDDDQPVEDEEEVEVALPEELPFKVFKPAAGAGEVVWRGDVVPAKLVEGALAAGWKNMLEAQRAIDDRWFVQQANNKPKKIGR